MRKHIPLLCSLILLSMPLIAQNFRGDDYYDDERLSMADVRYGLYIGIPMIVIGYLLSSIKMTGGFGKVIMGIGVFMGAGGIILYLLQALGDLLTSTLNLVYKLAIIGVVIYIAFLIINGIVQWFRKSA